MILNSNVIISLLNSIVIKIDSFRRHQFKRENKAKIQKKIVYFLKSTSFILGVICLKPGAIDNEQFLFI